MSITVGMDWEWVYLAGPNGLEEREVLIFDEVADLKCCSNFSIDFILARVVQHRNGRHV